MFIVTNRLRGFVFNMHSKAPPMVLFLSVYKDVPSVVLCFKCLEGSIICGALFRHAPYGALY